jgi:hypothetical protein
VFHVSADLARLGRSVRCIGHSYVRLGVRSSVASSHFRFRYVTSSPHVARVSSDVRRGAGRSSMTSTYSAHTPPIMPPMQWRCLYPRGVGSIVAAERRSTRDTVHDRLSYHVCDGIGCTNAVAVHVVSERVLAVALRQPRDSNRDSRIDRPSRYLWPLRMLQRSVGPCRFSPSADVISLHVSSS